MASSLECCGKVWKSAIALGLHRRRAHGICGQTLTPEGRRAYRRIYRQSHREQIAQWQKEYRQLPWVREQQDATIKLWRSKNREKARATAKLWRSKNREKHAQRCRSWQQSHRERCLELGRTKAAELRDSYLSPLLRKRLFRLGFDCPIPPQMIEQERERLESIRLLKQYKEVSP